MIPKRIHYCWFGRGEKTKLAQRCIDSWKRHCPDYEIIEWTEDNFDLKQHPYLTWCYEKQKWAFLSDYARLLIVMEHGGLYFDTDVELFKRPDDLLKYESFYGFENDQNINTGLGFGSEKGHTVVCAMVEEYCKLEPNNQGDYPLIGCPVINTRVLVRLGLKLNGERQSICGAEILPIEFLNPYDDPTGRLNKTENTVSVHWYAKSWLDKRTVLRSKLTKPLHRILGVNCLSWFKR